MRLHQAISSLNDSNLEFAVYACPADPTILDEWSANRTLDPADNFRVADIRQQCA